MVEWFNFLGEFGVTLIIVALFLWDWFKNKNKVAETIEQNNKMLDEIKNMNQNTAKSLELLQDTLNIHKELLGKLDDKCQKIITVIDYNKKVG